MFLFVGKSLRINLFVVVTNNICFYSPGLKDPEPYSVWIVLQSVCLSVIPSRFLKNGNIFGIKSDRLTKLDKPHLYGNVCPRGGGGVKK